MTHNDPRRPTTDSRRPTRDNEGQRGTMKANEGQRGTTKADEGWECVVNASRTFFFAFLLTTTHNDPRRPTKATTDPRQPTRYNDRQPHNIATSRLTSDPPFSMRMTRPPPTASTTMSRPTSLTQHPSGQQLAQALV